MSEDLFVPKEKVEKLVKSVNLFKRLLIISSVLFVVSIPSIVGFAIAKITVLIVISSVLCGVCFFLSFYGWVFWGIYNGKKNLLITLANNHLTEISEIADSTGKSKGTVKSEIRSLIKGGYLPGWKLNSKKTELYSTSNREYKCPSCGAPYRLGEKICTYCNNTLRA